MGTGAFGGMRAVALTSQSGSNEWPINALRGGGGSSGNQVPGNSRGRAAPDTLSRSMTASPQAAWKGWARG